MDFLIELAAFAEVLARTARLETLARWRADCTAQDKGENSFDPVTEADRKSEQVMRELIRKRFPDHGATGEEWPDEPGIGSYCWSLDPIDGTRSFICGLPTWTTLVALLQDGRPAVGLIDAPCLDETYVGFGGTAFLRKSEGTFPIRTSGCTRIADARLSTTDPFLFDGASASAFDRLRRDALTVRYGHDGYAYARLAAGSVDLVVECGLKPYDYHALIPLVAAAGGSVGDWRGGQDFTGGRLIAAATKPLFDQALAYFEALE
jgi:myo-inositol-1(or 4)-monophosphatase